MRKYIHYGSDHFEPEYFSPIQNEDNWAKPTGGLWASDVDALFSWKEWCECEDYEYCNLTKSFSFTLREDANVLHIHSIEDLKDLPTLPTNIERYSFKTYLDFEKLLESGIDAIEVYIQEDRMSGRSFENTLYWKLYGWDCDSILVMNPDIIQLE